MDLILSRESGSCRLWAATGGRPFDPGLQTVVFVHGAGHDHTVWSLPGRWFAHHARAVLALDLPGHGRSGGPPLASVAELAEVVIRALDAAGVERAALVGHSLGGLVVLSAAARHPERVRALGLVATSAGIAVHPNLLSAAASDPRAAAEMIVAWGFATGATFGPSPIPGLSQVGVARQLLARARPGVLHADLLACQAFADGAAAAAAVRCPTLLVLGAADRMTPARDGRALAAAIPGARTVELPGIGHMVPAEAPEPLLDALTSLT